MTRVPTGSPLGLNPSKRKPMSLPDSTRRSNDLACAIARTDVTTATIISDANQSASCRMAVSLSSRFPKHRTFVMVTQSCLYVLAVGEAELRGDLPDLALLLTRNGVVGG